MMGWGGEKAGFSTIISFLKHYFDMTDIFNLWSVDAFNVDKHATTNVNRPWLVDCMVFDAPFDTISFILQQPVHLSIVETMDSGERRIYPVAMIIVNPQKEYWPSHWLNQRPVPKSQYGALHKLTMKRYKALWERLLLVTAFSSFPIMFSQAAFLRIMKTPDDVLTLPNHKFSKQSLQRRISNLIKMAAICRNG